MVVTTAKCTRPCVHLLGTKFVIDPGMTKFELNPGEEIVREEKASYFKSRLNLKAGKLVLTNHRVVFCARPRWAYGFGLIGMLIAKPNRVDVELATPTITAKREDEKGFLALASASGEYKFAVSSGAADWLNAL